MFSIDTLLGAFRSPSSAPGTAARQALVAEAKGAYTIPGPLAAVAPLPADPGAPLGELGNFAPGDEPRQSRPWWRPLLVLGVVLLAGLGLGRLVFRRKG